MSFSYGTSPVPDFIWTGGIRKVPSADGNSLGAYPTRKMARLCEAMVGFDRLVGAQASAATDRTLPGATPICQLFSTLDETAVETTGREKSAPCLRPSQDSAATSPAPRHPACPQAAGTARGRPGT